MEQDGGLRLRPRVHAGPGPDRTAAGTAGGCGCRVIRAETASGSRRDGRTELQVLLDFGQPGDSLVVTRVDRLARSVRDLQEFETNLRRER